MRTETAVQQYWDASLSWRGKSKSSKKVTVQILFEQLHPLVVHSSFPLVRQAQELSDMIVRCKRSRCSKPRRKLTNLIRLPVRTRQDTIAA